MKRRDFGKTLAGGVIGWRSESVAPYSHGRTSPRRRRDAVGVIPTWAEPGRRHQGNANLNST